MTGDTAFFGNQGIVLENDRLRCSNVDRSITGEFCQLVQLVQLGLQQTGTGDSRK